MNYSSPANSSWTHTTDGTNNAVTIAIGCSVTGNNTEYYSTTQPGGNTCRLVFENVTFEQAGVYLCFDGGLITYRNLFTVIGEC